MSYVLHCCTLTASCKTELNVERRVPVARVGLVSCCHTVVSSSFCSSGLPPSSLSINLVLHLVTMVSFRTITVRCRVENWKTRY